MAKLDLQIQTTAASGKAIPAVVVVAAGNSGATVTVKLDQVRGVPPFFSDSHSAALDENGGAVVTFSHVKLKGPTRALLVASVEAHVGFYAPDAETVEVL